MIPLLIALALQSTPPQPQQPPTSPPAATPPPAEPESSASDTLAGLEETYNTTCGQTGILYYAYADLCDGLRRQIGEYRNRIDRAARLAARRAAEAAPTPPKR